MEYVLYPDEGHGFNKKENQMTTSIKTLEFLDKYLKPKRIEGLKRVKKQDYHSNSIFIETLSHCIRAGLAQYT